MAQVLAWCKVAGLDAVLVAAELALERAGPGGRVSPEHVLNVLARLNARHAATGERGHGAGCADQAAVADTARYDRLRRIQEHAGHRTHPRGPTMMRDVITENSRRCGCTAWPPPGPSWRAGTQRELERSRWLIEHLLKAEATDRAMRSVSHQMPRRQVPGAPRPGGLRLRGLAGGPQARHRSWPAAPSPTAAHNVVLVGGPGTGKTPPGHGHRRGRHHPSTASGCGSTRRWTWSTRWSRRRPQGKAGRIAAACCAWTWSSSMSWATCRSARPAGPCCSTCCPSCTSTPAW
jgi:hypothetical protein